MTETNKLTIVQKNIMGVNRTMYIKGEYILYPCENAFNSNTTYWLTKKGCGVARYCFTDYGDLDEQLKNIDGYIELWEKTFD